MQKAIEVNIGGIKCDAKGCDYTDDSAKFENYPLYLNKPCPKCGANLLTEADMHAIKASLEMIELINTMKPVTKPEKAFNVALDMNGSGKITPRIKGE